MMRCDIYRMLAPGEWPRAARRGRRAVRRRGPALLEALEDRRLLSANPPPVQIFYTPVPEDQALDALISIDGTRMGRNPESPIQTDVSIAAVRDGTIIYYDHWEDGFEADIANPTQPTTQIWGDGDASNGSAPGLGGDLIEAGDVIVLENPVPTHNLGLIDFDGGDKFGASASIAVTRAAWAVGGISPTNTLLAGALEVFDTGDWGRSYRVPVGVDTPGDDSMFEYTGLVVMARADGTAVAIDIDADGVDDVMVTLDEGESYLVDGGVRQGASVVASDRVQVDVITGDIRAIYESRWFTLTPTEQWSSSYYTPVATTSIFGGDRPTVVFVYNPGPDAITVNWETVGGARPSFEVAAGATARRALPLESPDTAAHFFTADGSPFYALTAIDDGQHNHDWGMALIPRESLTTQVLVGLGLGSDPDTATFPSGQNYSPVWVTTVGNGATPVNVYVDYDADPSTGAFTDPAGNGYDAVFSPVELESLRIRDPDGDQTGMLVYILNEGPDGVVGTADDTTATLAAAWGQDPQGAPNAEPAIDVGTAVPPLPTFDAGKNGTLDGDNDGDGFVSPGDTLQYTIVINNISRTSVHNVELEDFLPVGTTYVAGSPTFDADGSGPGAAVPIPDDGSGTPFPLDEGGVGLGHLHTGGQFVVTFKVDISDPLPDTVIDDTIVNTGEARALGEEVPIEDETPVYFSIGDFVWDDADGDGIQDAGEPGVPGVTVYLLDGGGTPIDSDPNTSGVQPATTTTDADGLYVFAGLSAGDYIVEFVLPDGYLFTEPNRGGNDRLDSDANVSTGRTGTIALADQDDVTNDAGLVAFRPEIEIIKLTNGTDNNSPTGPVLPVGSAVGFTYVVRNSGNVPLSGVTVEDDQGVAVSYVSGDADGDELLDVTEIWIYSACGTVTAGQHVNIGTATGTDPAGTEVEDEDVDHHFGATAGVNIVKLTNGTDNNSPTGPLVPVDSTVTFTYVVTNTGNVPLSSVTVTDDWGLTVSYVGGDDDGDSLLDITETWTFTASTAATAGQHVNTGTVTGNPVDEDGDDIAGLFDATDSDIDHHFGVAPVGGGGHTPGYWGNRNGLVTMNDGGTLQPELALLRSLNLRNANGSHFDPRSYDHFRSWLRGGNATNMAYQLSVQLAAMVLNVEAFESGNSGFVNPLARVNAPELSPFASAIPGYDPATLTISIADLITAANSALGDDGLTRPGDPNRPLQEALKGVLDQANNNVNFE